MSLFRGREPREEQRAVTSLPWSYGGDMPTATISPDRAMHLVPVFAAIGLLARTISCTPLHAYRRVNEDDRVQISLPQLFAQLHDVPGALIRWLFECVGSIASRGNAIGLVTSRDGFGFPTAVSWLPFEQVTVDDAAMSGPGSSTNPIWRWNGRTIQVGPANTPSSDIIHIPWFPVAGRVMGLSPLGAAMRAISTGLSAQEYADTWYADGGVPGTFKNSARTLKPEEADAVKSRLVSTIRSRKPLVYGSDWDYSSISIAPKDAEFVATAKLTATQIAAIYDVPPERIGGETGGSLTYSSPEQAQLHLVTFSLRNWFELLEGTFAGLLPNRQYVLFNVDSLIRTDIWTRHNVYKISREIGLRSIDECRGLEDLAPLPGGKGADFTPLAKPTVGTSPPPAPGNTKPPAPVNPNPSKAPVPPTRNHPASLSWRRT